MRLFVALALLAGCDKLFLQQNDLPIDAAEIDGPPTPGCPPEFANRPYYIISSRLTWAAAEAACRGLGGTYSHLAVVGSAVEATTIGTLITDGTGDHWVGLTKLGSPTVFHWITLEAVGIPWQSTPQQQPDGDGDCGRVSEVGLGVADTRCVDERRAVCECDDFIVDKTRF